MIKLQNTLNRLFGKENFYQLVDHAGIFIGEKKTQDGKIYQIIFIDTTDNWLELDYSQYLEKVVIDKYYKTEGYLQWNFYYYIISNEEKINANFERKKQIQNDETYTRKSIFTEAQFSNWVNSFEDISKISEDVIATDLYSNWVKYLREKRLNFVYNTEKYINYKQPVENYINGFYSHENDEFIVTQTVDSVDPILNEIRTLDLSEGFREYPATKNFNLGKVNLIHGANAVGKTSFFDALELIITGKIFYKDNSENYNIKLTTDDNSIFKFPDRPFVYKKRDAHWYKSESNRGNELNIHFNKFNYFTSDAAFHLKQDDGDKKNNLEQIIADIALGREVNKLEDRIKAFYERFTSIAEGFLKESSRLVKDLQEKNEIIKELNKEQNNPQYYKEALVDALNINLWKNSNVDDANSIVILDNEIQSVNNILNYFQNVNIEAESLSKDTIKIKLEELTTKKLYIDSLKKEILESKLIKQDCLHQIEKNQRIFPIIDELAMFFNHSKFSSLLGLENKIAEKNIDLIKAREVKYLSDIILVGEIRFGESNKDKPLAILESEILKKEIVFKKRHRELELEIKQIEEGIEELSLIVNNIKNYGKSYLDLNKHAENCPLCDTKLNYEDLVKAVEESRESFLKSKLLLSAKENLSINKKSLLELGKQFEVINTVKKISLVIFGSMGLEKTINEILAGTDESSTSISILTEELLELNIIQSQLNNANLTEVKFHNLNNMYANYSSIPIKSIADLEIRKMQLSDYQYELTSKNIKLEKLVSEKTSLLNYSFTTKIENEEQLNNRLNIFKDIYSNFQQLESYLAFPGDILLENIRENVFSVNSIFQTYKIAVSDLKQKDRILTLTKVEIDKILEDFNILKPKQKRAEFASTALKEIIEKQSKNAHLSDYLNQNKQEIVSIFNLIHSPTEFRDITFIQNKINLITNDNVERNLSEISTGQRSALALSIFLSLNKKLLNGPNIIMFDDPVTYVDDLNILSFFDYLRELVIKSKRQIFFATANEDLAFLFKKKFEFLEADLVEIKLERLSKHLK